MLIRADTLTILKAMKSESIDCVITSPPYWGLRDYQLKPQVWDGDEKCEHQWNKEIRKIDNRTTAGLCKDFNTHTGAGGKFKEKHTIGSDFCSLCGCWRGSLGLELTFELYLKHLLQIFDEIKRVLKKTGTCWVVLGDSYCSQGESRHLGYGDPKQPKLGKKNYLEPSGLPQSVPPKSLCLIPQRFQIEMVKRGWIARNTIIWFKRNCMPQSCKDRFTVDFEYVFFFVKSNKPQYWVNEKTGAITNKQPKGTKGIEGTDWDWKEQEKYIPDCQTTQYSKSHHGDKLQTGKLKKVSNWAGRDYWFEQQFRPLAEATIKRSYSPFYPDNPKTKLWYEQKAITPGRDAQTFNQEVYKKIANGEKQTSNMRCVWDIPTWPFKGAHFAIFPGELVKPMIKAGAPTGGIVLDPFAGAGTVGVVCAKLGRKFIGIDLSLDYCKMAKQRIAPHKAQAKLF